MKAYSDAIFLPLPSGDYVPQEMEEASQEPVAVEPQIEHFAGDPEATWVYWHHFDPKTIPMEWIWERLRNRRDGLLSATDHRMVTDAPWDTAPWAAYRQALRDLPENTTDPRIATWPDPPTD